jgi:hypothetical protein
MRVSWDLFLVYVFLAHLAKAFAITWRASEISNIFIFFVLSKALLKLAPEIRV